MKNSQNIYREAIFGCNFDEEPPTSVQKLSKSRPRVVQESPRGPKKSFKSALELPKAILEAPRTRDPLGSSTILGGRRMAADLVKLTFWRKK